MRFKSNLFLIAALVIVCSYLISCRSDKPPKMNICIGDGFGGADCVLKNGQKEYWPPSRLANSWITTQEDMERFASWCYDTSPKLMRNQLYELKKNINQH